jgi:hypothetical protein
MKFIFYTIVFFVSFELNAQNSNGVLKGVIFMDSVSNINKDTLELRIIEKSTNKPVSTSKVTDKINLELHPNLYTIIVANSIGLYLLEEIIEINYSSITFVNIDLKKQ